MKHKGITLVELLAVLVIFGIIALIAVPTVNTLIRNTQNRAIEASLINMEQAVRLYRLDRGNEDPVTFEQVFQALHDANHQLDGSRVRRNAQPQNATPREWELYAQTLLGPYISGSWPRPPFGGIFTYRFFGSTFRNNNLRELIRNDQDEIVAGAAFGTEAHLGSSGRSSGEFLQIRFGTSITMDGGGLFDLDDERTRDNSEAFLRTVEFLLDTQFGDRIFVWHTTGFSNNRRITPLDAVNPSQLVIFIYID